MPTNFGCLSNRSLSSRQILLMYMSCKALHVSQAGAASTRAQIRESAAGLCVHLGFTLWLLAQHVGQLLSSQDIATKARARLTLSQVDITAGFLGLIPQEPQLTAQPGRLLAHSPS